MDGGMLIRVVRGVRCGGNACIICRVLTKLCNLMLKLVSTLCRERWAEPRQDCTHLMQS